MAAANEVPASGQIVFELDTNRIKIGNGQTAYNSLPYLDNDISLQDVQGLSAALQAKANAIHTHFVSDILDAGTAALRNAASSGDAAFVEVVLGSDSRLTNQRVPLDGSVTAPKLSSGFVLDGGSY